MSYSVFFISHVFSVYFAIFHVLICEYLLFLVCCLLAIFQVLQCVCHFSHVFQCFLPYFMSHLVIFSFSSFVTFLSIFQVLQCAIFIFQFISVSRHIPGHTVFVSHFPRFSVFSSKSRYYSMYFTIFHVFHCFSPYFSSCSVCFWFCRFFSDFCHNSCPRMWVSHFPHLSVFSPYSRFYNVSFSFFLLVSFIAIFHVLQWAYLIFHVFQCFSPYSR